MIPVNPIQIPFNAITSKKTHIAPIDEMKCNQNVYKIDDKVLTEPCIRTNTIF